MAKPQTRLDNEADIARGRTETLPHVQAVHACARLLDQLNRAA